MSFFKLPLKSQLRLALMSLGAIILVLAYWLVIALLVGGLICAAIIVAHKIIG
jgi:hypothetical protein